MIPYTWGFWFMRKLRSAILNAAMGCEIAIKTYLREVRGTKDPVYTYLVDRNLPIQQYLDRVLELATGQNVKEVLGFDLARGLTAYALIRELFEVRNTVAHQGRAYRKEGGAAVAIDKGRAGFTSGQPPSC